MGANIVNGVASFGNALLNHPDAALTALGGLGLTVASSAGLGGGFALDATGVGAVAGVPLQAVSAAGVATGATMTGAAMASIIEHAGGDDRVEPMKPRSEASNSGPSKPPPEKINGLTKHGQERAMGRGVSDDAMQDAVQNPTRPVEVQPNAKGPTYKYEGKNATVVLNENGEVVTTYATGRAG